MRVSKAMCAIGVGACALVAAAGAEALNVSGVDPVPPKETGKAVPVMLARGLAKIVAAQGSDRLDGGTAANPYYGYDGDGPMVPAPGDTPTPTHQVEATKTEPDKNTYLVLHGQHGAEPQLQLRHALPLPGPRGRVAGLPHAGSTSTPTAPTASR